MTIRCTSLTAATALGLSLGGLTLTIGGGAAQPAPRAQPEPDVAAEKRVALSDKSEREADRPDSFWYYGPNGLWKSWTPAQREGRDTWILWTGGNQKFLRLATNIGGSKPVPISIEYLRMLDSRNRGKRFQMFGLVNEPNCVAATEPDEFGLYLDKWKGDPYVRKGGDEEKYADAPFRKGKYPYYPDPEAYPEYGEPTDIVGLRKASDNDAVVDGDFRVRGVDRLRVVDASIFPKIPGFFIVTSVYMAAEKAADVIQAAATTPTP